mmetsp:Transcript_159086/g.510213  ORF Transcript_159086/g.510213 Transcript_159086/m.510213 type:complete len:298 (+) Transcript_159086:147-1040(+)
MQMSLARVFWISRASPSQPRLRFRSPRPARRSRACWAGPAAHPVPLRPGTSASSPRPCAPGLLRTTSGLWPPLPAVAVAAPPPAAAPRLPSCRRHSGSGRRHRHRCRRRRRRRQRWRHWRRRRRRWGRRHRPPTSPQIRPGSRSGRQSSIWRARGSGTRPLLDLEPSVWPASNQGLEPRVWPASRSQPRPPPRLWPPPSRPPLPPRQRRRRRSWRRRGSRKSDWTVMRSLCKWTPPAKTKRGAGSWTMTTFSCWGDAHVGCCCLPRACRWWRHTSVDCLHAALAGELVALLPACIAA